MMRKSERSQKPKSKQETQRKYSHMQSAQCTHVNNIRTSQRDEAKKKRKTKAKTYL